MQIYKDRANAAVCILFPSMYTNVLMSQHGKQQKAEHKGKKTGIPYA